MIATAVFLFGIVAEPLVHAYAADGFGAAPAVSLSAAEPDEDAESDPLHDESQCVFCKITGLAAPAAFPELAPDALDPAGPSLTAARLVRAPTAAISPPSRAPPRA